MRTVSFTLSPRFPDQCGNVITKIPDLIEPVRGPVFLMENTPRESVVPGDILHGLSIKDVFVLTLEVVLE